MTYKIYGKIVESNIELKLINNYTCECEQIDIFLEVDYEKFGEREDILIYEKNNIYYVELSCFAQYQIDIKRKLIRCKAKNYEAFFSTFFNIPFSVYSILTGDLLLHSCTMLDSNYNALCFVGPKGVGKSTLTSCLNHKGLTLYSDDTILIKKDFSCYRGHNLIKYTEETKNNISLGGVTLLDHYNAVGKQYGLLDSTTMDTKVKKIIKVYRNNLNCPTIKLINKQILQRTIFYGNIVGSDYLEAALIEKIDFILPQDVKFFHLGIPNGLHELKVSVDEIIGYVI